MLNFNVSMGSEMLWRAQVANITTFGEPRQPPEKVLVCYWLGNSLMA